MTLSLKQPGIKTFFTVLFWTVLAVCNSHAQKYTVDVITLQNGDIYRGIIAEQPDSQLIRINTLCHNTLNFNKDEIISITSEKINLRRSGLKIPFHYESGGYVNITDFGLLIATGNNSQNAIFSVSTMNGYAFSSRFITGAGTGIELYETLMMPLYADARIILLKSRLTPFVGLKTGYSFSLEDPPSNWGETYNVKGGFCWGLGAGILIWSSDRSAFEINLSYHYQAIHSETTYDWSNTTSYYTTKYNRLELRFGFLFQ
jgi:hypothetical protein